MIDTRVDAAIVGGGPAGLATAIKLARVGRTVAVVERTRYERFRAGETLGGEVRQHLAALGVWDRFERLSTSPFVGVSFVWGSEVLTSRPSLFHPLGDGLHVDRVAFDRALADTAQDHGASVITGAGRCAIHGKPGAWSISADGLSISARYLVDASGRGAPATRDVLPERKWLAFDRLVGLTGRSCIRTEPENEFILEAVAEGWGYAAPQPDGSLLLTLMTDRDLPRAKGRASLAAFWRDTLTRSTHLSKCFHLGEWNGKISLFGAESGLLLPDRGDGWRAVGDAAMACDPLAGNGVARALASGIQAGEEIDRELGGDSIPASDIGQRFSRYIEQRDAYYLRERRWPEAPFWIRRQPVAWASAPIMLGPTDLLALTREPDGGMISAAEALIPYRAVETILNRLRKGLPAHEAISLLRSECPFLPDGRLICALQLLLHHPGRVGSLPESSATPGNVRA